jgi:hypothetical protein
MVVVLKGLGSESLGCIELTDVENGSLKVLEKRFHLMDLNP